VSFNYIHVRAKIEQQIRNLSISFNECLKALLVSNNR